VALFNDNILFVFNAIELKKRGLYESSQEVRLLSITLVIRTGGGGGGGGG